jgi:hypothetical protein
MQGPQEKKTVSAPAARFWLWNGLVFAVFAVLWAAEYRMPGNLSDQIDRVVVPWLWLVSWFTASFCTLRGQNVTRILMSIACTIILTLVLLVFVHLALAPIFDPMW